MLHPAEEKGRQGDYLVSGFTRDYKNQEYFFDYNMGAININGPEDLQCCRKR